MLVSVLLFKYLYGGSKTQELLKRQKEVGESFKNYKTIVVKTNISVGAVKQIIKESKELKTNSFIYEKQIHADHSLVMGQLITHME